MFTAGRGKSESTFTVVGFRDGKHVDGKSGVLQNHVQFIKVLSLLGDNTNMV